MTYFLDYDNIYKITRETSKTFFYKMVLPYVSKTVDVSVVFLSMNSIKIKLYDTDLIELDTQEHKILKSKFNHSKVIEETQLNNTMFYDKRMIILNDEMVSKHYLFQDDGNYMFELSFKLKYYVASLTSAYIENQVFNRKHEYTINVYNELLQKLKTYYEINKNKIINNMDQIKHTLFFNSGDYYDFENTLNNLLQRSIITI